jgi:hypothetical protein
MTIIKKVFVGDDKVKEVVNYFMRYNPYGYDTQVVEETSEKIVVTRMKNCD